MFVTWATDRFVSGVCRAGGSIWWCSIWVWRGMTLAYYALWMPSASVALIHKHMHVYVMWATNLWVGVCERVDLMMQYVMWVWRGMTLAYYALLKDAQFWIDSQTYLCMHVTWATDLWVGVCERVDLMMQYNVGVERHDFGILCSMH